jgi:hypothetical protein
VQRGLFAYALGNGETFDTIYFRESRSSGEFAIIEGAWLLRPALAEARVEPSPTPPPPPPEPEPEGETKGEGKDTGGPVSSQKIISPNDPPTGVCGQCG